MDSVKLKNNKQETGQKLSLVAEKIYRNLNQGNLFEIHRILESIENEQEKSCVINVFIKKFDFNFLRYI